MNINLLVDGWKLCKEAAVEEDGTENESGDESGDESEPETDKGTRADAANRLQVSLEIGSYSWPGRSAILHALGI